MFPGTVLLFSLISQLIKNILYTLYTHGLPEPRSYLQLSISLFGQSVTSLQAQREANPFEVWRSAS